MIGFLFVCISKTRLNYPKTVVTHTLQ